jgi:hypothetical protein
MQDTARLPYNVLHAHNWLKNKLAYFATAISYGCKLFYEIGHEEHFLIVGHSLSFLPSDQPFSKIGLNSN